MSGFFFLPFSFIGTHCVGCIGNHFRFLQPACMAAGLGAWLRNTTFFKVLEGVSETPRSNSNRGVQEERLAAEIEEWEEVVGSRTR